MILTDHAKQTGVALEKAYQFVLWLVPTVEKFPRTQKFLLGDRIQSIALDVLEGLSSIRIHAEREYSCLGASYRPHR
jgi:hypothetical protein